jgi:hypothetical protein
MTGIIVGGVEMGTKFSKVGPLELTGHLDGVVIHSTGCHRASLEWLNAEGEVKSVGFSARHLPRFHMGEEEVKSYLGNLVWGKTYCDKTNPAKKGVLRGIHIGENGVHAILEFVHNGETKDYFVYMDNVRGYKKPAKKAAPAVKKPGGWGKIPSSRSL